MLGIVVESGRHIEVEAVLLETVTAFYTQRYLQVPVEGIFASQVKLVNHSLFLRISHVEGIKDRVDSEISLALFAESAGYAIEQVVAHHIPQYILHEVGLLFFFSCFFLFLSSFHLIVVITINHLLIRVELDRADFCHQGSILCIVEAVA